MAGSAIPIIGGTGALCWGLAFRWALVPQFLGRNYDRESRIVG